MECQINETLHSCTIGSPRGWKPNFPKFHITSTHGLCPRGTGNAQEFLVQHSFHQHMWERLWHHSKARGLVGLALKLHQKHLLVPKSMQWQWTFLLLDHLDSVVRHFIPTIPGFTCKQKREQAISFYNLERPPSYFPPPSLRELLQREPASGSLPDLLLSVKFFAQGDAPTMNSRQQWIGTHRFLTQLIFLTVQPVFFTTKPSQLHI